MTKYDISKSYDHPLFMDELPISGSNDALDALKLIHSENETPESIAIHYNNLAREYLVEKAKGYLKNALSCYTKGINSGTNDSNVLSTLYSNRAYIYIQLGKYVEAVTDCKKAIASDSNNPKGYYRGAKSSLKLELYNQGLDFCQQYIGKFGEITDPAFMSLYKQITYFVESRCSSDDKRVYNVPYSLPEGVDCVNYTHDGVLHFSGVIDFVADMSDADTLQMHLDEMFKDNNFQGIKFNTNVVAFLEIPENKLLRSSTNTSIFKALNGVKNRYDVLPIHILRDDGNKDKFDKIFNNYEII